MEIGNVPSNFVNAHLGDNGVLKESLRGWKIANQNDYVQKSTQHLRRIPPKRTTAPNLWVGGALPAKSQTKMWHKLRNEKNIQGTPLSKLTILVYNGGIVGVWKFHAM